ncbi:MFS-type transporter SLC18B1 [Lingula anatina]|uniref:MFS-type transporter SLC18B1 n=1 Tax=Lingula anatina TaxID=7574 RepID=A0A1S3H9S5_LINAN|nr:MFS-type transporter SLC18B1 [Lingula anatina]|eukprot:XP_013381874.1 MFS-type transporter SLC18B1 [Lingula anatina]
MSDKEVIHSDDCSDVESTTKSIFSSGFIPQDAGDSFNSDCGVGDTKDINSITTERSRDTGSSTYTTGNAGIMSDVESPSAITTTTKDDNVYETMTVSSNNSSINKSIYNPSDNTAPQNNIHKVAAPNSSSITVTTGHNNVTPRTEIPNPQTNAPYMDMNPSPTTDAPYENLHPKDDGVVKGNTEKVYEDVYPGGLVTDNIQSSGGVVFKEPSEIQGASTYSEGSEGSGEKTEEPPTKWTTRQKLTVLTFALANLGATCCFSLLAPFFPDEAAKKGSTKTTTGLIFGCFELVIFISSPIFGALLTRIGSRFMYCAGIMVAGCCAILFGFLDGSPPGSVYVGMCFAVRIVEALGCSLYIVASWAIIAHTFPNEVSMLMGTLETFSGIGMMAGPALGGALYSLGGFRLPFFVMGSLVILIGLMSAALLPPQDDAPTERKNMLQLFKAPSIILSLILITVAAFGLGYMDPTLSQHLEKLDPSLKDKYWLIGIMFLIAPGMYAFTAPLWGYLADKTKRTKTMMIIGMIVGGTGFILMGPWQPIQNLFPNQKAPLWIAIVGLTVMGLGVGGALIPVFTDLFEEASYLGFPETFETQGMISGITSSAFSLGAFLGPTIGGLLTERLPFEMAAAIVGGCSFTVALLYLVYIIIFYCVMGGRKKDQVGTEEERQSLLPPEPVVKYNPGAVNAEGSLHV